FGDAKEHTTGLPLARELLGQLRQHPALMGLAQTPLLLTLICLAFCHQGKGRKLRLPATRCELYAECLEGLLGRWPASRPRQDDCFLSPREERRLHWKRELLAEVAWHLSHQNPEYTLFSLAEIEQALETEAAQSHLGRLQWTTEQALAALTETHGLLTMAGTGAEARYLFLHRTLQEYPLAWALARNGLESHGPDRRHDPPS